jgi:II/X family phage/plasmid replication protein
MTLRSNALTDMGCAFLGDYGEGRAMGKLIELFNERTSVLSRATQATDDLDALPRHLRATARDYLSGMDMTRELSRATFYRHRLALLPYGIDIAMRNVRPFVPRVRVVELRRAEIPDWYRLDAA